MVNSALIGRRTTISASAFTGRAVAPGAVAQPDPVTTGLINKNSLQLGIVSNQMQNLTAQVNSLSGSMTVIANNLATSQALERRKEQQDLLLERRLAEQQLREGKESAIERKIENKTIEPAQKLSNRAQLTLGRLGNFFFTLLGGWLGVNTLKLLSALSGENGKELRRLKEAIVSNMVKMGSVMLAGKAALALLTLRFKAFGVLALGAAAANYFSDPISQFIVSVTEALQEGIPGLFKLFTGGGGGGGNDSTKPPSDLGSGNNTPPPNVTPPPDSEDAAGDEQPPIDPVDPTIPPDSIEPPDRPEIETETGKGNLSGTGGPSLDSNVQPVTPVMGREPMSADQLKGNEAEQEAPVNPDVPAEYGETEMNVNVEPADVPIEGDPSAGLEPGQMKKGDTTLSDMGYSVSEVQSYINQEKYIGKTGQLPANMFTPMSKDDTVARTISQSTEPGVTVVPMPIPQQQTQQSKPIETPASQGAVSGVPNIPTANEDNIYLLGAYSNFNVVPS